MGLNVESMKRHLQDEDCVKILKHCKEPKSFSEVKQAKVKDSKLFAALKDLKLSEALLFAEGKYYTSPEALPYLE